jgi:hypothetical protein
MIGRRWMDGQAGMGPRINDPQDFVRLEIMTALSRDIRVIPVLLDGAHMPGEAELPEPLWALARRNALEVSHSHFRSDIRRLIATIRRTLGESVVHAIMRTLCRRTPVKYGCVGGLTIGAVSLMVYLHTSIQNHTPLVQPPPRETVVVAKNPQDVVIPATRPAINGEWEADVIYDWPNARYVEKFSLRDAGDEVYGTASMLGTARGILEGSLKKDTLRFVTRTQEVLSDWNNPRDVVHRYRGTLVGSEIKFIMQTEGGYSSHVPIEFVAKKVR